jgi:drug/metabolite transporter (DMT)-like permease
LSTTTEPTTVERPLIGIALVVASSACYAALPILVKIGYRHGADALGALAIRYASSTPLLLPFLLDRARRSRLAAAGPQLVLAAILFYAQNYAFFEALKLMGAGLAVLVLFLYPALVALGAALFLDERLTGRTLALALAGTIGVALTVGASGHASAAGVAWGVGAAASFAAFMLFTKRMLSGGLDGLTLTTAIYVGGTVVYVPIALAAGAAVPGDVGGWCAIVAGALAGTVGGSLLLFLGMRHLAVGAAAITGVAEPPIAVVLAAVVLGEPIAALQVVGMLVIIAAVVLLGRTLSSAQPL